MDPKTPSPLHLWSPRPFGSYSSNHPPAARVGTCEANREETKSTAEALPQPIDTPLCQHQDDDCVLLDTWYVIKPGNTKEKVAFFVAYQCAGSGSSPRMGGTKVKGRWSGSGSSRAKRRRHALDPDAPSTVAEMIAMAESRGTQEASPRPPVVLVTSSEEEAEGRCKSVAEAVAQYEAERTEREVRIAFRVAERPGDPITCDLYQLLSPEPHHVRVLLEKMETSQAEQEDKMQDNASAAGFHVDLVLTGAVDRCVFYGGEAGETEPLPGQLFFPQLSNAPPLPPPPPPAPPLCRLYRHVSHDFLEIRFQVQRLLQPRLCLPGLPDHVLLAIFSYLPTQELAVIKCTCRRFRALIEDYGVQPCDSRWSRDPLYRDDPCKQCKRVYQRGDVSICRWHPKPYHHDLPYGRSYWMCCRRPDRAAPGCQLGLHDNNWVLPGEGTRGRGHREGDEGR
ncbi:F-box only protein 46 [Bombina bombina]|uniref:F-box only protein 46 n=1 Tax=Bombina bombina TaxID=8345 RepID=UPI00235A6285|nr:F-box only protein 46 [Bombina bombina]XP_053544792.1 F-box only protein 46 [Bombina bombina]XP_053544793.1 F-box only protein 46 [Bombina bombina]